ncbi:two-component system sensor protein [Kwoniella mangroviensis CBS 10435]|uniref:histidine kinase n=1 Tax=Kwoniella mangroviensis CBS 10435 TaxID=1331196 RepID=A0A1B9INJ1_9TREE|nr:two-component system sensor protein [Kwoniella mangroviensis CBS 10435]
MPVDSATDLRRADTMSDPYPAGPSRQSALHNSTSRQPNNHNMPKTPKTRFKPSGFSQFWQSVKTHLTPPSHPSTTSESAIGGSSFRNTTDNYYYNESVHGGGSSHLPLELLNPKAGMEGKHKRRMGNSSASRGGGGLRLRARSSQAASTSRYGDDDDLSSSKPNEPVSHIVVDANFEHFTPAMAKSDSGFSNKTPGTNTNNGGLDSKNEGDGEDGGDTTLNGGQMGYDRSDIASTTRRGSRAENWVKTNTAVVWMTERFWPNVKHFLDSEFPEPSKERSFQKETWFTQKQGAMASSVFFLINWILTVGLLPTPMSTYNYVAYIAVAGLLTLPIPVLVIFDFPRRHPTIWQPWIFGACWVFAYILIIEMRLCGFFSNHNTCGTRNFLNLLGFAFGQPTLGLLTLRENRITAICGASIWLILVGVLVMEQNNSPKLFFRNIVFFALFHAFLICASFLKERGERQMFALRQQLKIQYRATQSAQVMERRAADSKKRFVSYIFHEVRVPLNTALLAVQNLEGEHVFKGLAEDQSEMVHGLMGSLTMMEKVLNDVLSFNRMESGKFAQARKPFEFHKSIQLVALSHRMQAQMAGIELEVELDKDIDKIGGVFVGDEMRLRQVASNLVSNSIKFTDKGSVRIVTKLLYPRMEPTPATEIDDPLRQAAMNLQKQQEIEHHERNERLILASSGGMIDIEKGSVPLEIRRQSRDFEKEKEEEKRKVQKVVVRVEIHDTGVGLRKQDVIDNRLFSPYVQTEIGRRQGGKGSGLGLALVRQIVKLSNGRLGVESEFGKGSMFWFELPYSLPPPPKGKTNTLSPPMGGSGPHKGFGPSAYVPTASRQQSYHKPTPSPLGHPVGSTEMTKDASSGTERPAIGTTDSTLPLLPEAHGKNQTPDKSELPTEEIIMHTYPPVDPPTPEDEGIPESDTTFTNPFTSAQSASSGERRSSEWSDGTRLELQAPPIINAPPQVSIQPPPESSPELPLCVLVVDDDKLTRMLMSRMLTRLGHQVSTAENGKIAFDMIKDSFEQKPNAPRFDAIFLDNQMPLMSGVEVAREVRDIGCPVFIVGCTGNALREDQEEYISAGADSIIPKPIHQKAIVEMIKEARKRVAGETKPKEKERDLGIGMGHDERYGSPGGP